MAEPSEPAGRVRFGQGWLVLMVAWAAFVGLYRLGSDIGFDEHECLVAQTAREMRETGDWIVPHYGMRARLRKTPLPYWVVAALSYLTGRVDEWTARLPSALGAVGVSLCVWWLGRELFGPRAGLVGGFAAASSTASMLFSHDAAVDMQLTFYCALCYALFWKGLHAEDVRKRRWYFYGFYLAFGMGMLAKGPMPVPVVALPILVYLLLTRQWQQFRRMHLLGGAIVVVLMVLPWVVAVAVKHPPALAVWKAHFLDRFTGKLDHSKPEVVYYYIPYILLFAVPWLLSVPEAVATVFLGRYRSKRRELLYVWCWLVVNLVFFTIAGFKRPHYILPAMPALFVLLGAVLEPLFFGPPSPRRRLVIAAAGGLGLGLAAGLIGGGVWVHREWPVLFRPYLVAAAIAAVGFGLAVLAFVAGRRGVSFGLVNVTAVAVFCWLRPTMGPHFDPRPDAIAFARIIKANVPEGAELRWVGKQVGAVMFYGNLKIPRFKEPATLMAQIQQENLSHAEVLLQMGRELTERLKQPEPIWLVMEAEDFALLRSMFRPPARMVALCEPTKPEVAKSLVVVTNVGATSGPARRAMPTTTAGAG